MGCRPVRRTTRPWRTGRLPGHPSPKLWQDRASAGGAELFVPLWLRTRRRHRNGPPDMIGDAEPIRGLTVGAILAHRHPPSKVAKSGEKRRRTPSEVVLTALNQTSAATVER